MFPLCLKHLPFRVPSICPSSGPRESRNFWIHSVSFLSCMSFLCSKCLMILWNSVWALLPLQILPQVPFLPLAPPVSPIGMLTITKQYDGFPSKAYAPSGQRQRGMASLIHSFINPTSHAAAIDWALTIRKTNPGPVLFTAQRKPQLLIVTSQLHPFLQLNFQLVWKCQESWKLNDKSLALFSLCKTKELVNWKLSKERTPDCSTEVNRWKLWKQD